MSYRHPLQQTQTVDYSTPFSKRQPSNASSVSTAYSNSSAHFELSRTSTLSSTASSGYQKAGHNQGASEAFTMAPSSYDDFSRVRPGNYEHNDGFYKSTRQSLKPLPQAPASSPPQKSQKSEYQHVRGHSLDRLGPVYNDAYYSAQPPKSTSIRPTSMLLSRADSINHGRSTRGSGASHTMTHAPLTTPDLQSLEKSSTGHLRTLSKFAQLGSADEFSINNPAQEVVGLHGRRKLQRNDTTSQSRNKVAFNTDTGKYGWEGRNWMDKQRQFLQAYEYLCHIGEAKEWIEDIIHKPIPPIVQLEEALRDGVTLAEIVAALHPERRLRIFRSEKLQYRHSDNIAIFFRFLSEVELPDLFRFELIDLYEKKNTPKVIYCIHALSWLLFRQGVVDFRIGNLVGQLEFEHHELEAMQKGLDKAGVSMPSFGNMGADFGIEPTPEPEPVETEEERVDRELQENELSVVEMQAQIRGAAIRMRLGDRMQGLWDSEELLIELQSRIRGDFARQISEYRLNMKRFATNLQGAARGFLVRNREQDKEAFWKSREPDILKLQNLIRARQARQRISHQRQALLATSGIWRALQAASRGKLHRTELASLRTQLRSQSPDIASFQALVRGAAVRTQTAFTISLLHAEKPSVLKVQAIARGMILRRLVAADYESLSQQTHNISRVQALGRGVLVRKANQILLGDLEAESSQVIRLQGLARAMLLRNDVDVLLGELEAEEDSIIALQASAQACLVRAKFAEKQKFFKENMEKVVKIQSFVRGRLQGEAYKSLTTGKNPPVNTVKNFVHLLNDSDFDFNEEIEFERLRKSVVQQVRQNEMAEQYVEQLDIKIALLVKNKITLDDVMQHQRNYGGHAVSTGGSRSGGSHFDLKALNKNSRRKLDSYQQLFFTLQTQPQYLARLFKRVREQGTPEQESKQIETLMMGLFGYAQKRREEYYLLRLIARSVKEEVDESHSIQDYLRGNFFWSKLLSNYTRSPRDRKYLRELLAPLIRDNIIEDPALDLESDPLQIYRSAINNEELTTGRASRRPLDVTREVAIKDKETRGLFIDHLRDLREISDQFLLALEGILHMMPYGIRYISQQMFQALCERFPREPQQFHLQIVGHWLWRFYLQPALTAPQETGVIEQKLTPLQKRNLVEVGKVLGQVALGKLFGGENIYLQPLNAYIGDAIERIGLIMANVIEVRDAETAFDIDEFNDLYAKTKPTLYIKMTDIFAIHNLVAAHLAQICPNRDDMLREIVQELGSAKNNENEMLGVTSAEIQMTLNPKLHDVEDPEAEVKALFMETKRCILYIIRVQSGPNLMDILVRPISREDDQKWQALLKEEFSPNSKTRGAYSDASTLVDITSMSYAELKRTALENIMRLETQFGRISRHNYYQDLLNAIAVDIRTKSRRRVQRQRELEGVRLTLANLNEKAVWLESQCKSYDNYIEQAMMTLQNKKGKKRFLLPFTRQYNHERELQRAGRQPKFGSFKYSARNLFEKGVLVSWNGYSEKQYDKINVTISCDEVGVFFIEGSMGSIQIPGASAQVPLEVCLTAQFDNNQFMNLFEGALKLNVNLFLHLIYKKFYRSTD